MQQLMLSHWQIHGHGLFADLLREEHAEGRRIIREGAHAIAFVPACARYPYETWIAPRRPVASIAELSPEERRDLAGVLRSVLRKFDRLWSRPFPYLMVVYQAPTDQVAHPEWHLHFQIYPPYRTKDKLKFLAGTELGAGMFVNDSLPEEKAAELRAVEEGE
jgi:UDPglucose--hexose-1-phosphate uridylyltransferase